MWLLIGVCAFVLVLGLIGHTYPRLNNLPPTYSRPVDMPDLRVSEFAPDWHQAHETYGSYKFDEDMRQRKEPYILYYQAILEIKARRWKEGNPVTKKNPIDPDEMPINPSRYYYQ